MATVFSPEHCPLDRLFAADTTYRIPAYQRPYSWQAGGRTERSRQVDQMWEDLWSFFEDNRTNAKEYFLGSMVIVEDKNALRNFEVIDGQQRLTTLLLLFSSLRCFLQTLRAKTDGTAASDGAKRWLEKTIQRVEAFIYNESGPSMLAEPKLKIERKIGANYNQVLASAVSCEGQPKVDSFDSKQKEVALRYFRNRDFLLEQFAQKFLPSGTNIEQLDLKKLDDFFVFLRTRVAIVLIKTSDFSTAYRIFEILNNRGLPLSNLDLLRNFVLEQLVSADTPEPDKRWELLESKYTFTEDFIGRWTESVSGAQPKASAFNEAVRLFDDVYEDTQTEKKIHIFCRDLEQNLFYYNLVLEHEQRIEDSKIRNAVSFIKLLGNERYSADLMLALFRAHKYIGKEGQVVLDFLSIYRTYALFVYLIGRFSTPDLFAAIQALNEGRFDDARRKFVLPEKDRPALRGFIAGKIERNDYAKVLLAAYVWNSEEETTDVVRQYLDYDNATLEHIIPQQPAAGSNWLTDLSRDFRDDFTYRLGNMTLLTHSKNSANRNYDFAKKRQIYAKSKLPMTVKLGEQTKLTEQFFQTRHDEIVQKLISIFAL